jgi:ketosteroid isomerase-like protein
VSDDREAQIRRQWERWNAGDRESHMGEVAEDFVVESAVTGRSFTGRAGLVEWMAEIDESFEGWRLWIDEVREITNDRYLVLGGVHLRGRGSGVEFDQPIGWVVDFRGESVVRLRNLADHDAAIAAANRE